MANDRTRALAYSYAHRVPRAWWDIATEASRETVDAALVVSVLALESGNRGRVVRAIENSYAALLILMRRRTRFERMSLGIAQLQPRRVGLRMSRASRRALADERFSIESCVRVVTDSCAASGLDPIRVPWWDRREWRSFGWAHNGSRLYGNVLESTYAQVRTRTQTWSNTGHHDRLE